MTLTQSMPPSTTPRPDAPVPWRQIADKPAGGFVKCPTDWLMLPWGLYRAGRLDFLALRTWFGLLELPERRCDRAPDKDMHYSLGELCQLLDVPRRAPVQAAVRTLEDLGLVAWSMSSIDYLPTPAALHYRTLPGYQALQAQLHPWRTWVPAPRRLLRWLAREGTPGLCATAAGVLLRCLWSKQRQCVSGGRVAAAWIARGFGVAERTVHRGLDSLQECGWLTRFRSTDTADAGAERRHGARTVVNLDWDAPGAPEPEDVDKPSAPKKARRQQSRPACQEVSVKHVVKHPNMLDQNVSPLPPLSDQNVSPLPREPLPETPEKHTHCATPSPRDFYPLQEQRPDPLPALRAPEMLARACQNLPTGFCHDTPEEDKHLLAQAIETSVIPPEPPLSASTNPAPLADPAAAFAALPLAIQDELLHATTAQLVAHGLPTALRIQPAVLAEAYAHMAPPSLAIAPREARRPAPVVAPLRAPPSQEPSAQAAAPVRLASLLDPAAAFAALPQAEQDAMLAAVTARLLAQGMRKELLIRPVLLAEVYAQMVPPSPPVAPSSACREALAPATVRPPCPVDLTPGQMPGAGAPPDLYDVVPADLRDLTRLETLRQQAIRRGWLTGCDADRLNFVAAAVHARRIGDTPCALFVALVRHQRWEVITQEDEDQACALLRQRDPRPVPPIAAPTRGLSEDAQFVRGVQQILRQAGWRDDPFLAIAQRYPGWTRVRWDAALTELHTGGSRG